MRRLQQIAIREGPLTRDDGGAGTVLPGAGDQGEGRAYGARSVASETVRPRTHCWNHSRFRFMASSWSFGSWMPCGCRGYTTILVGTPTFVSYILDRAEPGELASLRLVIVGADDATSPPEEMRAMAAAMPESQFAVIPDAGHLAPIENPAGFNAVLGDWLRRLG